MIERQKVDGPVRVDGKAKVTGKAKYSAEYKMPNMAHGYLVTSAIAKGKITEIDTSAAERAPGVVKVLTYKNVPKLPGAATKMKDTVGLQSEEIFYNAQPIAVVLAETFEQARYAAGLVKTTYEKQTPATDSEAEVGKAFDPSAGRAQPPRGNPAEAFQKAEVKIDAEYVIPIEHHNPMEPGAAVASWDGDKLTIYNKTQGTAGAQRDLATDFGVPPANVTVIAPFVGGAFGAALRPSAIDMLAAMASREIKRPVKIVTTRRQMFTAHGYRPYTIQKMRIGADKSGKLTAIIHEVVGNTSSYSNFQEGTPRVSRSVYACPNVQTDYKLVKTDLPTPLWMRAPGNVSGAFALESALDELSYHLKIDPLELRLINYADVDPDNGKPFSSKELKECYRQGAEKFGWKDRKPEPRSMRDGNLLVGWGMATGTWGAGMSPATVRVTMKADGSVLVECGVTDIGPGTYTTISIIAAHVLGLPIEKVKFVLGRSDLPPGPSQGGSTVTASVGTAAQECCEKLLAKLYELAARATDSPFKNVPESDAVYEDGRIKARSVPNLSYAYTDVLKTNGLNELSETHESKPDAGLRSKYSLGSHGAQFIEVKVDEDIGRVKVTRVIAATAAGKIINPKGAHSQEMGAVVWGIGMALTEETEVDHRYGRMMNATLAGYHVPVNADVHEIETIFVPEEDKIVNPLGVKGLGELGMVGVPAAIANAIYHATGKRIRHLPITPDKLL
jgi:xanthine dehydrogenase YagR molybdenum-binding subunit